MRQYSILPELMLLFPDVEVESLSEGILLITLKLNHVKINLISVIFYFLDIDPKTVEFD